MTYYDWIRDIQFLKDKIILPSGNRVDKSDWVNNKGFDFDKFNKFLLDKYNELYKR